MKNLEIDRDGTKGWTAKGMSEHLQTFIQDRPRKHHSKTKFSTSCTIAEAADIEESCK